MMTETSHAQASRGSLFSHMATGGEFHWSYRVMLEVDQHCNIKAVEIQITNGEGNLMGYEPIGFALFV